MSAHLDPYYIADPYALPPLMLIPFKIGIALNDDEYYEVRGTADVDYLCDVHGTGSGVELIDWKCEPAVPADQAQALEAAILERLEDTNTASWGIL